MHRFRFKTATLMLSVLALACGAARAQEFPSRSLRLIVALAPGGSMDIAARAITPKLSELLGQPVVVENRPGAGSLIGIRAALQAPPDGYTMLITSNTVATNSLAYKNPGYKMSDFIALHPVMGNWFALSVNDAVPAKTLAELVAYARANPGKLTHSSLGAAGIIELAFGRFKAAAGITTLPVSYGGAAPAYQAVMSGIIDLHFDGTAPAVTMAKSGKTRILATSAPQRLPSLPDVPTFAELGYPTMVMRSWIAIFASAKTPEPIVQRLQADLGKVLVARETRERLVGAGLEPWTGSARDFPAYIRDDTALLEQDIRRAGISLNE